MTSFIPSLLHTVRWVKSSVMLNKHGCFAPAQWTSASCVIHDSGLTAPGYSTLYCSKLEEHYWSAILTSLFRAHWVPLHPLAFRRGGDFCWSIGIFFFFQKCPDHLSFCLTFCHLDSVNQEPSPSHPLLSFGMPILTAHPVSFPFFPSTWNQACWVWITAQHSLLILFLTVHMGSYLCRSSIVVLSLQWGGVFVLFCKCCEWTPQGLLNDRKVLLLLIQWMFSQLVYMAFMWYEHPCCSHFADREPK